MKKRLFVGIKISDSLSSKVGGWRKGFEEKLNVRWLRGENLHTTLVPPWYEHEERLDKIIGKLTPLGNSVSSFEMHFDKVEFGPDKSRPRLIWATGEKPKEIYILEKLLSQTLKRKGQKRSKFIHLTLARFNIKDLSKMPIKRLNEKVSWKEKVISFSLFESKLKRSGAEYSQLKRFEL